VIEFSRDFVFAKVNAKEDTTAAQHYGIAGFPTVVLLNSRGEEIDRILGFLPPQEFIRQIEDYLAGKGIFSSVLQELEEKPNDVHLIFEVAERYYGRAKLDEAVDHYEKVFWWDQWNEKGKSDLALYYIGIAQRKDKAYDQAIVQFQRLIDTYPNSQLVPDAIVYKGYVYGKWGKTEEAIATYEGFLSEYPDHGDADWVKEQIAELKGE
jgi:TolA-binding protein